jgi:hypothetical protein
MLLIKKEENTSITNTGLPLSISSIISILMKTMDF